MAMPNDGLLGPIAALLQRRRRGARATDPETLDELRSILDAAPAPIIAQGPDGAMLTWNRAAARLLGWAKLEADDPVPDFIPPDARTDEAALRRRILAGNEVFRAQGRFLDADGAILDLLVSAAPRRNAAGKIVGTVIMLEEPVGIGPTAVALPPATEMVPEAAPNPPPADRAVIPDASVRAPPGEPPSRLLAKVSHDLRQPLHALSLLTGALERRVKDAGARELVDDAGTMIRALQTTFDNLVDLGKLDEGSVQAHPTIIPVSDVLSPLAVEFAREADRRNIDLRHVGSTAVIYTDPLLLQRLLRQLLANALRFAAREDGTRGKVLFGARRRGDRLRLTVADNGAGISRDQQASIFEPFVQSDAGRAAGGLGLGLAIAARLARLLDTMIGVQSQPGKGSRFWIDVPLERRMDEIL
jgi:PAS domain S-box-containing protein